MDGFNGEIVAYKIADNQEVALVKDALSEAIISIKYKDLILHSDQGAVYTCPSFQNFVKQNGITMSMSRKGNCHDNAAMESFFSSLKTEAFYSQGLKNLSSKMVIEIVSQYIDYYNKEGIPSKIKLPFSCKIQEKGRRGCFILFHTKGAVHNFITVFMYIIGIKIITIIKI